jgi:hypothetical protein
VVGGGCGVLEGKGVAFDSPGMELESFRSISWICSCVKLATCWANVVDGSVVAASGTAAAGIV